MYSVNVWLRSLSAHLKTAVSVVFFCFFCFVFLFFWINAQVRLSTQSEQVLTVTFSQKTQDFFKILSAYRIFLIPDWALIWVGDLIEPWVLNWLFLVYNNVHLHIYKYILTKGLIKCKLKLVFGICRKIYNFFCKFFLMYSLYSI